MRGRELTAKYRELMQLHRCKPLTRPPLALLSPVEHSQIIEGVCASSDIDAERMSFARGALTWSDLPPLQLRHSSKIVGRILALIPADDGRLQIKAQVDDLEAARMPAFSVAVSVFASEVRNENSAAGFHFVVKSGRIDEVSLSDRPKNGRAVVISRRDVVAIDDCQPIDAALAAAARARVALEKLRAALSAPKPASPTLPTPLPTLKMQAAPPRIYGKLPSAIVSPRQTSFSTLVAHLPTGDGP